MKKQSLLFSLSCLALGNLIFSTSATAQVTTDGTTNTTVNSDSNGNFTIEQGDRAGDNLFHSFGDFSVPTDGSAFFNNATDISNIFSRVTGGNISNIDGLIRANDANLFLINPAGIMFGNNARLDIGGSFFGTTADSILFEDGEFNATNLDNPPLLTINAPIGLNFRDNPQPITNNSFVQNEAGEFVGLEVEPGNNLSLIGGDVIFELGQATARGGRVEIGGLRDPGTVTLELDNTLTFPEGVARANVSFANAAGVNVVSEGGGSISVNANNIELTGGDFGGSQLAAGILSSSTSADNQAGDIVLDVTGAINISQGSNIFNQVQPNGVGNAGNITLNTTDLTLLDGSQITAGVFGTGNAGVVTINASGDTTFQGIDLNSGLPSGILNNIALGGSGNAGDIQLNTTNLNLVNGGSITSDVSGTGNAGSITINVNEAINISGSTVVDESLTRVSQVSSSTGMDVVGNAGSIEISTDSLTLANGSLISSSTFGEGNAGLITIDAAGTISADGESSGGFASGVFSTVGESAIGNSGGINITTSDLTLTQGGVINGSTFGQGNAGAITINAAGTISADGESSGGFASAIGSTVEGTAVGDSGGINITTTDLTLTQGGIVAASTFGQGDAGVVSINATGTISADGERSSGNASGVFSTVEGTAVGNSGGIDITTTDLTLTQGGVINGSTFGQGNAGAITINAAGTISADGESSSGFASAIGSTVEGTAAGDSGGINITTTDLTLTQGGIVAASTFGQGDAGVVSINATGTISADGERSSGNASGVFSTVEGTAVGNSGGIDITTTDLTLTQGGVINGSTFGQGNAGAITINAAGTISADGESSSGFASAIGSTVEGTAAGDSGGIDITTTDLTLTQGGVINGSTFGQGNAGAITINAAGTISADGERSGGFASGVFSTVEGVFSTVEGTAVRNSGGINITTTDLTLTQGGVINGSTFGEGNAGGITIDAAGTILADGESSGGFASTIGSTVGESAVGNSGRINITTSDLTLTQGGAINGSTFGQGNAGLITINAAGTISADGENLAGFASAIGSTVEGTAVGNSGGINITTSNLTLSQGGAINGSTSGQGNAGAITIDASGNISAEGESFGGTASGIFSLVNPTGVGDAAGINIDTNNLSLTDNAGISVSSLGEGNAANLTIVSDSLVLSEGAFLAALTPVGTGGSINLQIADRITLRDNSLISAQAFGTANGGNLTIDTDFIIAYPGNNDIIANAQQGQGGVIIIDAESLLGIEERDFLNDSTNDINASSQDSTLDGDIFINTSDVNPAQRTTELPSNIVEPGQTVAQACSDRNTGVASTLMVKGRGGVPTLSNAPLSSEIITVGGESETSTTDNITTIATENGNITLARGAIKTADGQIILTPTETGSATRAANGSPNCG